MCQVRSKVGTIPHLSLLQSSRKKRTLMNARKLKFKMQKASQCVLLYLLFHVTGTTAKQRSVVKCREGEPWKQWLK